MRPPHLVDWNPPSRVLRPGSRDPMNVPVPQPRAAQLHAARARSSAQLTVLAGSQSAPSLLYQPMYSRPPSKLALSAGSSSGASVLPPRPLARDPLPPIGEAAAAAQYGGGGAPARAPAYALLETLMLDGDDGADDTEASAPALRLSVAQREVAFRRQDRPGSRWAQPLPRSGRTPQAVVLDEARRRMGRPPRAEWQQHLMCLRAVVGSLVENHKAERALRAHPLFKGLTRVQTAMLSNGGVPMSVKRYASLYRAAAPSSAFYILLKGTLNVSYVSDDGTDMGGGGGGGASPTDGSFHALPTTLTVARGDTSGILIGEEALSKGVPRRATVTASEPCELLCFHTRKMSLDDANLQALANQVWVEASCAALRRTPLFKDLQPDKMASIARLFRLQNVPAETALFLEGDVPKNLYILLAGSVDLVKRDVHISSLDGAKTIVGDGHPFFGAAALLEPGATRPWDVFSRTPCSLLVLSVRSLKPFLRELPDFSEKLKSYIDMRRRAWELETGRPLPVGEKNKEQALEEAAVMVQLEVRRWEAKKTFKQMRDKEVLRRMVGGLQTKNRRAQNFVNKIDMRSQKHFANVASHKEDLDGNGIDE